MTALFKTMQECRTDFTNCFRILAELKKDGSNQEQIVGQLVEQGADKEFFKSKAESPYAGNVKIQHLLKT